MIIGIDVREALGNKTGKGSYIYNILTEVLKLNSGFNFILYSHKSTSLFEKFPNVSVKIVNKKGFFWHFSVARNLKKDKVDLFWAPTSYIIPFLLGKKLPYIITVHDIAAFLYPSFNNKKACFIERITLRRAIKYAKKIFVVSENTGKDLMKYFGVAREKLVVTYNGTAISDERLAVSEKEISNIQDHQYPVPSTQYLLSIGTLEPRKNYIRLIQAFNLIKDEFPDLELWIGGGKGWQYEKIFDEVKNLNLEKRVKFLGYVKDEHLAELYVNAELFAYISIYEGFGIPVIEAMKYGAAVLTSNNSSLPEVAGDAAVLVDALNVEEIANAMRKILKDENLRKHLSEKGLKRVKDFSWEKTAKSILSYLEN